TGLGEFAMPAGFKKGQFKGAKIGIIGSGRIVRVVIVVLSQDLGEYVIETERCRPIELQRFARVECGKTRSDAGRSAADFLYAADRGAKCVVDVQVAEVLQAVDLGIDVADLGIENLLGDF